MARPEHGTSLLPKSPSGTCLLHLGQAASFNCTDISLNEGLKKSHKASAVQLDDDNDDLLAAAAAAVDAQQKEAAKGHKKKFGLLGRGVGRPPGKHSEEEPASPSSIHPKVPNTTCPT